MNGARPDASRWQGRTVVVTGGSGFLGKPTVALLEDLGADVRIVRSSDHDLTDSEATRTAVTGADVVFHLAANVGGIGYNRNNPAPLIYENLMMGANVFEASRAAGVRKLVAACSVCASAADWSVSTVSSSMNAPSPSTRSR